MSIPNDIVFYWYPSSPYGRKIQWYLILRGLAHAQCMQSHMLPRPDLEALNVNYRRIPLLSLGRDVFLDTRLIIPKLEAHFPDGAIGANEPELKALERLFVRFTSDAGIFQRAVQLMPTNSPALQDPKFRKDRADFSGGPFDLELLKRAKPEALVHIRDAFELLETTLLADGRKWIFKTDKPSLGDIEAIWPLHWVVIGMPAALQSTYISANQFPKTFDWIKRFQEAVKEAEAANGPKPPRVKIDEVMKHMAASRFYEPVGEIDAHDPTGLKAGDAVTVWPTDSGSSHRDSGRLLTLTPHSIAIAKRTKADEKLEIHLHAPRWNFRVGKAKQGAATL